MRNFAVILHPTANDAPPSSDDPLAAHLARALLGYDRALKAALRGVMAAPPLERKQAVAQFATLLHTPSAFLAARLIDLAPERDRATLREHLL